MYRQTDKRTDKHIQRDLETDRSILIYTLLDIKTVRPSDIHFMHSYWQMELRTDRPIDKKI